MSLFLIVTGLPIQYWQSITRLEPSWPHVSIFLSGHVNLVLQLRNSQPRAVLSESQSSQGTSEHQTCTDWIKKSFKSKTGLGHCLGARRTVKARCFPYTVHTFLDLDWNAQDVGYAQDTGYQSTPRNYLSSAGHCERNHRTWQALQNFWTKIFPFSKFQTIKESLWPRTKYQIMVNTK